ncbi:RsmE family RNA methyltransferase [Neolewinella antarctica]|uniref:Ribosomal RNA small subunit methyltransferase E n=1 Tax=Neolewinella antarctica TaxID=442734 RepID=A0ABX0X6Z5_9BACT|nr:RsmE family RNA methyltransferase [Neolewinella antarctica]NJC24985.1 16S rRNA (uracil1498-N3)-methyltransferase [Neolewinella antarctica]
MQLFYDPDVQRGPHALRAEEARHAFQVLRKRVGDELNLVDGKGGWYKATVASISKRECLIDVTLLRREAARASYSTTLLVAPTKNIDRFEWILEKTTEIGIDFIQPILTQHSERKNIRTDRLERVIESAMKQSLQAWLPALGNLCSFAEALQQSDPAGQKYLAYLGGQNTPQLHRTCRPGGHVTIAVGPEGGFSPAEAELAVSADFNFVSLGPQRLRTETAAITAVHTIAQLNW